MEATIVNYRKGRHTQKDNQMVISVKSVEDKAKAASLIGKTVIFLTETGKEIKGKVSGTHGNKGAVRVIFEKGMPGQSLGKKIKIE